jgi:hypothetical protein
MQLSRATAHRFHPLSIARHGRRLTAAPYIAYPKSSIPK